MYKAILFIILPFFPFFSKAQDRPNIVIFFVDDLGWADVGYRNCEFHTPNINQLKKDGIEFTRAYVATPTCSPSRASLLTGKEPVRFLMPRHVSNDDPGNSTDEFNYWATDPAQMPSRNWLPLSEVTYAEKLGELGYYNKFIGKWHLGGKAFYPEFQGFDSAMEVTSHGHPGNYYPPYWNVDNPYPENNEEYLTDAITDRAVDFVKNYKNEVPFELSLFFYSVHSPHIGRKDFLDHYKAKGWNDKYANYGAMVSSIDYSLGRIRKVLRKKGVADNTIILFISDQGGFFSNHPLRGRKEGGNALLEGGMRVPFILHYPGVSQAGSECDVPIQTLDVYPTLLEMATGLSYKDTDIQGRSLMPLIRNKPFPKRNLYFFRSYENQYAAVVSGDWKLIKYRDGQYDLYNIKDDISENHNLVKTHSDIAQKLLSELNTWESEAVPTY